MPPLPRVEYALVGGSATAAIVVPDDLSDPRVTVRARDLQADTPFGPTPPLTLVAVETEGGVREALFARMHGWKPGVDREQSALALFAGLRDAGVRRVLAEAGASSATQSYRPRDLVMPTDVIDLGRGVSGRIDPSSRVLMTAPFCPEIRAALWRGAQRVAAARASRAYDRAVLVAVPGTRFETAAEVAAYAGMGAELIGAGVAPEVFLAREIGACYAPLTTVLNYAEGVRSQWDYALIDEILHEDARTLGRLLIDALIALPATPGCACAGYRKPMPGAGTAALTDTA